MGRILIIKDDGAIANKLLEKLSKKNRHSVKCAYSYASAVGLWNEAEKEGEKFNCIIIDLNISPNGLEEDEIDNYFPIHGILFLNKICKDKTPENIRGIWNSTIVFSAYIDRLKERKGEFDNFNLLELVSKQENVALSNLLNIVNEKLKNKK